jgi:hypothetical protein
MLIPDGSAQDSAKRRAVAALIAGIFIFSLFFTVGLGYFVYESQLAAQSSQAAAGNRDANLAAANERLILEAEYNKTSDWLSLEASNSGGVQSVISAVFITSPSGQILSLSTGTHSQYLVGHNDLNVTLPITLNVGVHTDDLTGCGLPVGCNIGINPTAFNYMSYLNGCVSQCSVNLNVLTTIGNTFSTPYPRSQNQTTTVTSVVSATTVTSTVATTMTFTSATTSTIATSSTIGVAIGLGTNSLVVSMQACPGTSPFSNNCGTGTSVYQGQEVVLKVSVTNFANVALNTYVNFQSVATNGASVNSAAPSSCAGYTGTQSIPANTGTPSTVVYTCTFSANVGSSAGTVTFIGYAVGSYTNPPNPPVTITSAESTSNPLQLGNPLGVITGPWLVNYFSFNYASSTSTSWKPATIISANANKHVVFQLKVTNTANTSLTILQYSYMLMGRLDQELDFFIVAPQGSYTDPPSAYTCTNTGAGGAPTGASCLTVAVGATTTLTLAACNAGINSYTWANNGGGNGYSSTCPSNNSSFGPPEGSMTMICITYEFSNGGKWYTYSQSVPSEGVFIAP